MIFSRRSLQRRVSELRTALDDDVIDKLARRLNRHGNDRLAAMWEVVILHALAQHGRLRSEVALNTGRRPDISFASGTVSFTADVTVVSDAGLDEQNPYEEFGDLIEALKRRLGLKIGGVDLNVHSKQIAQGRGSRTVLRLPERKRLYDFIKARIEPELRKQIASKNTVLRVSIDDEEAGFDLIIDPAKSPYSSFGHASYKVPTVKDRNPLYNVLKSKARQLRSAEGVTGIIVGDADSNALNSSMRSWNRVDAQDIVKEFLRQNSSIDFVFILSVRERQRGVLDLGPAERSLVPMLAVQQSCTARHSLETPFSSSFKHLPVPVAMPVNAARRAREMGYGWGHHGGHQMSSKSVRISSRELMEILAGRRTVEELNTLHRWRAIAAPNDNDTMVNPFDRSLKDGRLPSEIIVISTGEEDSDDWIEFKFGDPDPAISPIS